MIVALPYCWAFGVYSTTAVVNSGRYSIEGSIRSELSRIHKEFWPTLRKWINQRRVSKKTRPEMMLIRATLTSSLPDDIPDNLKKCFPDPASMGGGDSITSRVGREANAVSMQTRK